MKKIALFDFCNTVVNMQTADAFVAYVTKKNKVSNKEGHQVRKKILKKNNTRRFKKKNNDSKAIRIK